MVSQLDKIYDALKEYTEGNHIYIGCRDYIIQTNKETTSLNKK